MNIIIFKDLKISYYSDNSNYNWQDGYFQSALKGQEFVIKEASSVENWTRNIIKSSI